jgi:hypothetical protein
MPLPGEPGLKVMLAEAVNSTRTEIVAALQRASAATGSDFNYLLNTAMRESSLKPQAQSGSSSAAGLFQFIEQTWMGLVKEHGAQFGLGSYANAITRGSDGRFHAASTADRQAILALRKDPQTSAYMAGVFSQEQRARLQSGLGRDVCGGELYAAHFLGTDAACRLIQLAGSNPAAPAAKAFPQAASANRSVFYNPDGSSKTVAEVYNWALKKHGDAPMLPAPTTALPDAKESAPDAAPAVMFFNGGNDARLANAAFDMLAPDWMANPMGTNSLGTGTVPHSPFLMTPGVIDLLNAMSPASNDRSAPVANRRAAS